MSYEVGVPASIITSCGGEAQFGVCDRLTVNSYQIELEQEVLDRAVVHLQGEGRTVVVCQVCVMNMGVIYGFEGQRSALLQSRLTIDHRLKGSTKRNAG